ncbi:hypothetical protein EYV94_07900 [Puteibacter caeruleilacunae]|nr:hypothetical protein EYV94_07900 [Puteibacter caeruleilacunae]
MIRFWRSMCGLFLVSLCWGNIVSAKGKKNDDFEFDWETWDVSIAAGMASFFAEGTATVKVQGLPSEMDMEASTAFSIMISKPVVKYFSIGYELEIDKLKGSNPRALLTAMANGHPVLRLVPPYTPMLSETRIVAHNIVTSYERPVWKRLSAFGMAKFGFSIISTELTNGNTGEVVFEHKGSERVSSIDKTYPSAKELKVAVGGGLSYAISERFSVFGMVSTSLVQTDILDGVPNYNTGSQMTNVIGNYWSAKGGLTFRLQGKDKGRSRSSRKRRYGNSGGEYLPWAPKHLR